MQLSPDTDDACLLGTQAVMITHYGLICNVVQIGKYLNLNDSTVPTERKMYRPGSVSLASTLKFALVPKMRY